MSATLEPLRVRPGYRGLLELARAVEIDLEPFQRTCLRAAFGPERELAVILPRGSGKSTLAALLSLHVLATGDPGTTVAIGSTGRAQAGIVRSLLEGLADHPALDGRLELLAVQGDRPAARWEGGGTLTVISGRGSRAVGRTDRLMVVDEAWALGNATRQGDDLLGALQTSMAKSRDGRAPEGRMVVISTSAPHLDSPLGRMRARAMAGDVTRTGGHVEATVPGILKWHEWSIPEGSDLDDLDAVKLANPARWQTLDVLREAKARCAPLDWAQHHANAWGIGEGVWLPAGAWSACRVPGLAVADGEAVIVGVDVGGTRAETAVVAVTPDLRVASVQTFLGDRSVLEATDAVLALAHRYDVREVSYDPFQFKGEAERLEEEHGVRPCLAFPQTGSRMVPASAGLHAAIVEGRLSHPGHPDLDRHIANVVAKASPGGRGWRMEQRSREANIDAAIALAMAVDRAPLAVPKSSGWVGWL